MKLPRRATAGGTTRTPVARSASSLMPLNLVGTLSKKVMSPAPIWRLSFRRNDSSTAFLTHWCTVHSPTALRSATRSVPASRRPSTSSTAARTSGLLAEVRLARPSQARSMMDCRSCVMVGISRIRSIRVGGTRPAARAVPRGGTDQAEVLSCFAKETMRWAASRHSACSATRARRMRPAPGLRPWASRASRLPGRTPTLY